MKLMQTPEASSILFVLNSVLSARRLVKGLIAYLPQYKKMRILHIVRRTTLTGQREYRLLNTTKVHKAGWRSHNRFGKRVSDALMLLSFLDAGQEVPNCGRRTGDNEFEVFVP